MAQAGIHGMVGMAIRKWTPKAEWLMLGLILGNLIPDADNTAVAVATVAKLPTEGLHRTFTHSLITIAGVMAIFYFAATILRKPRWSNLGIGIGVGMLLHIVLDQLIWFNGVEVLWPIKSWTNLWAGYTPPEWFDKLMMPMEFFFLATYYFMLGVLARKQKTDLAYQKPLQVWIAIQAALFVIFTILVYVLETGFMTLYGALYLLSLFLAIGVTIRMRKTIEFGMA